MAEVCICDLSLMSYLLGPYLYNLCRILVVSKGHNKSIQAKIKLQKSPKKLLMLEIEN